MSQDICGVIEASNFLFAKQMTMSQLVTNGWWLVSLALWLPGTDMVDTVAKDVLN
jgi:hypothetical protein